MKYVYKMEYENSKTLVFLSEQHFVTINCILQKERITLADYLHHVVPQENLTMVTENFNHIWIRDNTTYLGLCLKDATTVDKITSFSLYGI